MSAPLEQVYWSIPRQAITRGIYFLSSLTGKYFIPISGGGCARIPLTDKQLFKVSLYTVVVFNYYRFCWISNYSGGGFGIPEMRKKLLATRGRDGLSVGRCFMWNVSSGKIESPHDATDEYTCMCTGIQWYCYSFHNIVSGTNWGLPLAIAANLHVPYRIELNHSYVGQIEDKLGAGNPSPFSVCLNHSWIYVMPKSS